MNFSCAEIDKQRNFPCGKPPVYATCWILRAHPPIKAFVVKCLGVIKMGEKKSYQAWTVSDKFWEAVKGEIPKRERDPAKEYKNAPGQGRKPMPARKALEGIFYVLRTGCHWKALPREYRSGSTVHRRFQEWLAAGFFEKIWSKGLEQYDELEGIGWKWQSLDGCMVKAPLALEAVGTNPTDRGKMGTKRSVLTDEKGLPLAIVMISGANTYDVKLLEETLDHIVVLRPEPDGDHPKNLCLDAGYTGSAEKVEQRNYIPHIRPRGEETKELERNPNFRAHR